MESDRLIDLFVAVIEQAVRDIKYGSFHQARDALHLLKSWEDHLPEGAYLQAQEIFKERRRTRMEVSEMYTVLRAQGLSHNGACALIGNIRAESAYKPNNLQNTGNTKLGVTDEQYTVQVDAGQRTFIDNIGYGLCQWTSSGRKQALLEYARKMGTSIGDGVMQLSFCVLEMKSGYRTVYDAVRSTSMSIREISDKILKQYERPKDQSEAACARRAGYGEDVNTLIKAYQNQQASNVYAEAFKDVFNALSDIDKAVDTLALKVEALRRKIDG